MILQRSIHFFLLFLIQSKKKLFFAAFCSKHTCYSKQNYWQMRLYFKEDTIRN